jgi:hypothetical protein
MCVQKQLSLRPYLLVESGVVTSASGAKMRC